MALERAGLDAGLAELMRGTRGRCETLDGVAGALGAVTDRRECGGLPRPGNALEGLDLIAIGEELIDRGPLGVAQVRIVVEDGLARVRRSQRRLRALPR